MGHRGIVAGALLSAASAVSAGDAFVGSSFGTVYRWNAGGMNVALPTMCVQIDAAAADGSRLYVADGLGALHRVDTASSMQVTTITWGLPAAANSLAVSGERIFVGSRQGHVRRIDAASGSVLQTWTLNSDLNAMVVQGDFIYAAGTNTFIYRLNTVRAAARCAPWRPAARRSSSARQRA
jgi:outer membrane protein assembly factor BamB